MNHLQSRILHYNTFTARAITRPSPQRTFLPASTNACRPYFNVLSTVLRTSIFTLNIYIYVDCFVLTDASHPVVLHHFHYCCCSNLRPWTRRWLFKPAADLHGRWQTRQMNPSDMTGFTELENGIVFLWMTICRFRPAVVLHFFEHITQVVSAGREGSRFAYPRSFSCDFLWLT